MTALQRAQEQAEEHIRSILNAFEQERDVRVAGVGFTRVEGDGLTSGG